MKSVMFVVPCLGLPIQPQPATYWSALRCVACLSLQFFSPGLGELTF